MNAKRDQQAKWVGKSGRIYSFTSFPLDSTWKLDASSQVSGIYIFARDMRKGWRPIYIGNAHNLVKRLRDRDIDEMISHGATHVHIHFNENGTQARQEEEADLIAQHKPSLSKKYGNKGRHIHPSAKDIMELDGSKIRALRNHYGLTQRVMSDVLRISQISFGFMDRGQKQFPLKRQQNLLKLFNLKPDFFDPNLGMEEFKSQLPRPGTKPYQLIQKRFGKDVETETEETPQPPLPKFTEHNLLSQHDGIPPKLELNFDIIAEKMVGVIEQITEPPETPTAETGERVVPDTSLITIGIYGPWGAGKSTLIHALDQELDDQKYFKIPLNPWKWDGKGTIHGYVRKAVLRTAAKVLYEGKLSKWPMGTRWVQFYMWMGRNWLSIIIWLFVIATIVLYWPDIGQILSDMKSYFSDPGSGNGADNKSVPGGNTGDGKWGGAVTGLVALLLTVLNLLGTPIKKWIDEALSEKFLLGTASDIGAEALQKTYRELEQAAKTANKRFVFFIDDLDRCMPERVTEFIESIHSLTTAGCIVFVACDEAYLAAAINAKHEAIVRHHPDKDAFGQQFLEKIVQIPFRIPSLNEDDIFDLGLASRPQTIAEISNSSEEENSEIVAPDEPNGENGKIDRVGDQDKSQEIKVDKVLLSQIFGELLDGHVKLLKLNLRQVKSLSNTINLLLAIFESDFRSEEDAKRMAAFIMADKLDPLWLDGHYHGNPTSTGRISMHKVIAEKFGAILGNKKEALDDLYWRIGRQPRPPTKEESGTKK